MKQSKSEQENSKSPPSNPFLGPYKVIPTPNFLKEASALQKKYPNIHNDFLTLAKTLRYNPTQGNDHVYKDVWKVRMSISDKGKGERGSARVIIEVIVTDKEVFVLSVYDKGEIEDLTDKEVRKLVDSPKPTAKTKGSKSSGKLRKK